MIYITKRIEFSASHRLYNPDFSEEKNELIFDKCNNINGHGHNYVLEVTISGEPDPLTGYVIDLKKLKQLLKEHIYDKVDHKHLNFDVDFLKGYIPTVENLAVLFWKQLQDKIPSGKLYKITLFETSNSWVEYFGESIELKHYNIK